MLMDVPGVPKLGKRGRVLSGMKELAKGHRLRANGETQASQL